MGGGKRGGRGVGRSKGVWGIDMARARPQQTSTWESHCPTELEKYANFIEKKREDWGYNSWFLSFKKWWYDLCSAAWLAKKWLVVSLKKIPQLNISDIVSLLKKILLKISELMSLCVCQGAITNILEESVVQPLLVSTSAIHLAAETVRSILKIDDIVRTPSYSSFSQALLFPFLFVLSPSSQSSYFSFFQTFLTVRLMSQHITLTTTFHCNGVLCVNWIAFSAAFPVIRRCSYSLFSLPRSVRQWLL